MRRVFGLLTVVVVSATASAAEPKLQGGKETIRIIGDSSRYHLLELNASVSASLSGPGVIDLKACAVKAAHRVQRLLHVTLDGNDVARVSAYTGAVNHVFGHKDLATGPASTRDLHIPEGSHTLVLTSETGPMAVAIDWRTESSTLTVTPLVAEPAAAPLVSDSSASQKPSTKPLEAEAPEHVNLSPQGNPSRQTSSGLLAANVEESPAPHRSPWPYVCLGGAVATAIAGAIVWGVATSTDGSYNGTPEGPGRNGMLNTANGELHAAMVLGAVAIGVAAVGTLGLVFQ